MRIKVVSPFSLRLASGQALRAFPLGEHSLSDEEAAHWFVQACLMEGRAIELTKKPEAEEPPTEQADAVFVVPTREALLKLKNSELEEMLVSSGFTPAPGLKKADLVELVLHNQKAE